MMAFGLRSNDKLLSIRGSNKAIVMGVNGPILEIANNSDKLIPEY